MNAAPFISKNTLSRWASEQAGRIKSYVPDRAGQAECAMQIAALGGNVGTLPIARLENSWLDSEGVSKWAAAHKILSKHLTVGGTVPYCHNHFSAGCVTLRCSV